jgi:signal transduction histidine kinase
LCADLDLFFTPMVEVFRSAQFRLSVLLAIVVSVSTALVFAFVYWHVTTTDISRLSAILTDEVAKSLNRSSDQLKRELDLRLTRDLRRLDYAALFDAENKPIFGNMSQLPESIQVDGRAHYTEVAGASPTGDSEMEPAIFVAGRRQDGSVLVLGRGLFETYYLRHTVLEALVNGIAIEIVLALTLGGVFGYLAVRRLQTIHRMIYRIMAGDLHERLPVRDKPDDIDKIVRAVNQMLDELVRALGQLRSMSANIAHDLRTPLSILRVKLERALNNPTEQDLKAIVNQAHSELERALTTIAALMRIAEIESGRRTSAFAHLDLAKLCSEVLDFYEPLAELKSVRLTLDEPPVPVSTFGDADLLREAVTNLVDNGVKYAPSGGEVVITTAVCGGTPVIRVCDNGPGIAPSERDKIFKRFYRSEKHRHIAGSGLGLSMTASIVELHGFSIRVEDNNPGACFEIICAPALAATPSSRQDPNVMHRIAAPLSGDGRS